jgi:hypothetical protein
MRLRSFRIRTKTQKSTKYDDDTVAETTDDDNSIFSKIVSLGTSLIPTNFFDDDNEYNDDDDDSLLHLFLRDGERERGRSKEKVLPSSDRYHGCSDDETLTMISLRPIYSSFTSYGIKRSSSSRKDHAVNERSLLDQESLIEETTLDDTTLTESPTLEFHDNLLSCADFIIFTEQERNFLDKSHEEETPLRNRFPPPILATLVEKLKRGMKQEYFSRNGPTFKQKNLLDQDSLAEEETRDDTTLTEDHGNTFSCTDILIITELAQQNFVDKSKEVEDAVIKVWKESNLVPPPLSTPNGYEMRKQSSSWTEKRAHHDNDEMAATMCLQEDEATEFLSFLREQESQIQGMCVNFNRAAVMKDIQETMLHALRLRKSKYQDFPINIYHEKFLPLHDEPKQRRNNFLKRLWYRTRLWLCQRIWRPNLKRSASRELDCTQSSKMPSRREGSTRRFLISICRCVSFQKFGKRQSDENEVDCSNSIQEEDKLDDTPHGHLLHEFLISIIEVDRDGRDERKGDGTKSNIASPITFPSKPDQRQVSDAALQSSMDTLVQEEGEGRKDVEIVCKENDNEDRASVEIFNACHGCADHICVGGGENWVEGFPASTNMSGLTGPMDNLPSSFQYVIDVEEDVIEVPLVNPMELDEIRQ